MTDRQNTVTLDPLNSAAGQSRPGGSPGERAATLFPERQAGRGSPDPPGGGVPKVPRAQGGWRTAVAERLPMWVQLRCGIEPKTLAALAVVLVAACVFAAYHFWAGRPRAVRPPDRETPSVVADRAVAPTMVPSADRAGPAPRAGGSVVVDVTGKVLRPGIQRLPTGSRVVDALDAAGGARPGTDTTGLNRARVLMDGEQIVVGASPGPAAAPPPGAASGPAGGRPAGPVSLNSATAEQLDALPGVGPVLAQHIVDYRTEHGGFRSVDELRHVNGIGARRFTDLRPLVQP
ncbi:ComEA family DNA-binding protein [Streptomyces olivoreticuli]|nr:ComEA family DNA-binding protein [Streptomyces olivoreticuli]WKK21979.1 ComEA family DNA-binding protein [Streptomyces olivoreticuli]